MSVNLNKEIYKKICICWQLPPEEIRDNNTLFLSFLTPSLEPILKEKWQNQFIFAREWTYKVRQHALELYIEMIAQIGVVAKDNVTFRESLQNRDGISRWWFHAVSAKNCEDDPAFNYIIQVLIISKVIEEYKCSDILICDGPYEVVQVLKSRFSIITIKNRNKIDLYFYFILPILRRIKFFISMFHKLVFLKIFVRYPRKKFDILFSGFWDWSVKINPETKKLEDRYFKEVSDKLQENGIRVGWLLWFHHHYEPHMSKRSVYKVVKPIINHPQVVILQCFLRFQDVIRVGFDFKPFRMFRRFSQEDSFVKIFHKDGFNFFPIVKEWLHAGFLDAMIPYHELVCLAHQRAAQVYQPKIFVSFLNFFLYARAANSGIKIGEPKSTLYDVQHASYSWEDTIGVLDAKYEFDGIPDGFEIPQAEYVFVMGKMGRDIFKKNGFLDQQILMTGSSRYNEANAIDVTISRDLRFTKEILIVTTMQKKMELELEMVDTIYEAFKKFPEVTLRLRSHPFSDIRSCDKFRRYENRITCSSGTTLEQDLANTDIVFFSYSTVAEESFIRGIPVWQWISAGYNASVFRDIKVIPTFFSVESLELLYLDFQKDPKKFIPSLEHRRIVKEQCFYSKTGGVPTDNITEILTSFLKV